MISVWVSVIWPIKNFPSFSLATFLIAGNAFALWLGIDPPEVFLFVFLPPLLLDSALTLDWFLFKKLSLQIFSLAFLVVVLGAALATPVLLYGLRLVHSGWLWQHAALFSAVVSATDAIAIGAVLHQAAGPTHLLALLEGESLLNDASALTIFELLRHVVVKIANEGDTAAEPFLQVR
jgi:NhaP-type Na+/H+ or K+/H+ antiporter